MKIQAKVEKLLEWKLNNIKTHTLTRKASRQQVLKAAQNFSEPPRRFKKFFFFYAKNSFML